MSKLRIFLIPNMDKAGAAEYTAQIADKLFSLGCSCYADDYNTGRLSGEHISFVAFDEIMPLIDVVITLGGDGTIIRSCKRVMPYRKKILGINIGRLGFLADLEVHQLELLDRLVTGAYTTEQRTMLHAVAHKDGAEHHYYALNDVTVTTGGYIKIVDLEVYCNDRLSTAYRADGVILSTPTGSTGYAMSAGGPIIDPAIDTIGLTPICPHSLFSRTILFASNNVLTVRSKEINNSANVVLCIDGESVMTLSGQDSVTVTKADTTMEFISLTGNSFCDMLNTKLLERR